MEPQAQVIRQTARLASERVAKRVVRALQGLKDGYLLAGDDSGPASAWDEICVQVQFGESVCWEAYDETVRAFAEKELEKIPEPLLHALWLQTDAGFEWLLDQEEDPGLEIPWVLDDVVDLVAHAVYELAGAWTNRRIERYMDSQCQ